MIKRTLYAFTVMIAYIAASYLTRPWSPHYPVWVWYVGGVAFAALLIAWARGMYD